MAKLRSAMNWDFHGIKIRGMYTAYSANRRVKLVVGWTERPLAVDGRDGPSDTYRRLIDRQADG